MWRSWWSARISSMRIISPSASITRRSGCVPASTRRGSPSRTPANARAAVRLPTPRGPWKRNAWACPSASAASRRRFASRCSGTSAKAVTNLHGELRDGEPAVDDHVAVGKPLGQLAIRLGHEWPERRIGSLDPVALLPDARQGGLGVDRDEDGDVREQALHHPEVQVEDEIDAEPTPGPLVGDGGVEVAIADDGRTARERRPDHVDDVLRPRGG